MTTDHDAPVRAGAFLNGVDKTGAAIITFNDGGPQWLYYCGRKGWILSPKGPLAEDAALFAKVVEGYRDARYVEAADGGARYLVADINFYGLMSNDVQEYLDARHERLALGDGFAVWRLRR